MALSESPPPGSSTSVIESKFAGINLCEDDKLVGGEAYTVAGSRKAIEDIIVKYGLEIIGGFHQTIDKNGGICYIRIDKAKFEITMMLEVFRTANILVWQKKVVNQSTNGYELDLATEAHLQFAMDNKNKIKFLGSPDIKKNIVKSIYPARISYTLPKGCYCTPNVEPVGTPNMCAMGVKINTVKGNEKKNNGQISKEDLNKILDQHQKKTVLPKQESKKIKTEKK